MLHDRPLAVPANASYCWMKRDSAGARQDPGNNIYSRSNVFLSSQGQLVLQVARDAGSGTYSTGEVVLDRSLGVGDYVWSFATAPEQVSKCGAHAKRHDAAAQNTCAHVTCAGAPPPGGGRLPVRRHTAGVRRGVRALGAA